MSEMPKITVVMAAYNRANLIHTGIQSFLRQNYSNKELLICDDCSTDNTFGVIKRYAELDNRIKIHKNPKNLGMMGNWINSIPLCKNKYWGKLDADDYWDVNFIEQCIF